MKLPAFLAAHARATPQREALRCGDAILTFGEFEAQSSRLAGALAARGVAVGDRVVLLMGNRIEFLVVFMAVVKAGAIAITLNPRLSGPEVGYILGDATPRAVFFDAETRDILERSGASVPLRICTGGPAQGDELSHAALCAEGDLQPPPVPPEFDDCMIGYTSGTTGKPKGAIITQSNYIVSNGFLNAQQWAMGTADRVLTTTPLAHRTAFSRLMNVICLGTPAVIMQRFEAAEAARLIETHNISVLGMVPTVGRMLLPEIEAAPQRFANLRIAVVTGEAFPVEIKRRLAQALPQLKLYSFFAMTELGPVTNLGAEEQVSKAASVGRVNPGVEVRLVDEQGRDVPVGEAGEIRVRSGAPGSYITMRGYFNKPRETAEAMSDGWFATGDMGRFDEQGYLYIVDRKKDMVLSGGYNIYSKEVENTLLEIPGVRDAAVVGVPDPVFGEAVAAFIEADPQAGLTAEAVVEHCRERIASYKKPKHVVFVDALPRNSTGKVLKYELRQGFATDEKTQKQG
ncbi:MAG: AMP-binding protein [Betaproteobacteria bacterium]|nr:AMP-binding protein [Betaproteobacteria bacterium]